jgi:predicted PurR-regulated permease PerM
MDTATRTGVLILATAAVITGMYWFRDVLAPFALAVFLWLVIDSVAEEIEHRLAIIPRWLALTIALSVVGMSVAIIGAVLTTTASDIASNGSAYGARLDQLLRDLYALVGKSDAPTIGQLLVRINPGAFLADLAQSVRGLASDALFVSIYVAFLFSAQSNFPKKLDALFPDPEARTRASAISASIRHAMGTYLWVQTFTGAITAVGCYVTMKLVGLDQALFWAFVIFLLGYVPTIGPLVGTLFPVLFALVQFPNYWQPGLIFLGVGFWQFSIGNFMVPRMQGDSMNLSTLVVILTLSLWGAIWGLPGMFLSAPLTVMLMIILAQFKSTRPVAVLLSQDGHPEKGLKQTPQPGL